MSELAREGIYEINVHKALLSALLELNKVLSMHMPELDADQQSWREQIGMKIGQACDDAKFDFQIDE